MANNKIKDIKPTSRKMEIHHQLITQLRTSLPELKEILGDKKFESRIENAAKLLSKGIKERAPKKNKEVKKKANKKEAEIAETATEK